ncbi:predicted protein [Histoplasma capsulatum G186AR]|uniref:Uncharacterized protein n=1 Tax=Ajellomyces capsulatus (strain G186AR / H82 / ATCC MYA-2454 / RMSCC 2432) TaxID=447093 RepID=C0NLU3_AJECG|nr:uncharacterized protein HCBG_04473 [Histoplasma capsulatum G186AR]EEH07594.1 predicted protein [Histoplasma capsulatum G186AR]
MSASQGLVSLFWNSRDMALAQISDQWYYGAWIICARGSNLHSASKRKLVEGFRLSLGWDRRTGFPVNQQVDQIFKSTSSKVQLSTTFALASLFPSVRSGLWRNHHDSPNRMEGSNAPGRRCPAVKEWLTLFLVQAAKTLGLKMDFISSSVFIQSTSEPYNITLSLAVPRNPDLALS